MSEIKLHLGCGKRYLKGFTHIDLANYKHIDYRYDVRLLPMFQDSTANMIYASHVLEYFSREEVVDVLREWRRVLKPRGILRLAVPNFEALIEVYKNSYSIDLIRGSLYGEWKIPGTDKIVYHKTVYDLFSLRTLLKKVGFINIKEWNWKNIFVGEHEGFDDYSQAYVPHMDKENGILISLNMEATK